MRDLRRLWEPRGVAVIGASGRRGSMGEAPVRHLVNHGYPGAIYPVNPNYDEVLGLRCYPSVEDCPGPVDLALVMVGADRVAAALESCARKGVGYAVVLASGFAESGAEGEARQRALLALARDRGLRIVGPNCIGLVNPHGRLVAGFSPLFNRAAFRPGDVGLVTQSGALGYGIVSLALDRGLQFSRIVNTGNEADFTSDEAVEDLLEDDVTRVVLVYSEGLRCPHRWIELAGRALERRKAIVMLKVGRSEAGARAVSSHTAALAGDDRLHDVALRDLGILRVQDIDELLDLAAALRQPRLPAGNRVGVLTTSGGAGVMAADACADHGLTVPELGGETRALLEIYIPSFGSAANPVDVTAQVMDDREVFRRCLSQLARAPGLDLLLCSFCVLTGESAERTVEDVIAVSRETARPVLLSKTGADSLAPGAREKLLAAGVPVFETPAQAARAAAALLRFGRAVERKDRVGALLRAARARPAAVPPPPENVRAYLADQGLPVAREVLATSPAEAVDAAAAIGYPVVLKVESPDIAHKTEVGGVVTGVASPEEVREAYGRILQSVRARRPDARIAGVLVQEQVQGGVEMLVGVVPSPFGPVITAGAGGVLVEVLRDTAMRLAPVDRAEAAAMLGELRTAPVLRGVRGSPPADVDALADLLVRVSELAAGWPDGWELDLNPVLVLPRGRGVRIVDALLLTDERRAAG